MTQNDLPPSCHRRRIYPTPLASLSSSVLLLSIPALAVNNEPSTHPTPSHLIIIIKKFADGWREAGWSKGTSIELGALCAPPSHRKVQIPPPNTLLNPKPPPPQNKIYYINPPRRAEDTAPPVRYDTTHHAYHTIPYQHICLAYSLPARRLGVLRTAYGRLGSRTACLRFVSSDVHPKTRKASALQAAPTTIQNKKK
ncbi:hypothetical protein C8R43DRAFT_1232087 [Mycena crocata]|nr:hypothetical protein C8R43DRAFT_1232087 [Mycena crocata]